MAENKFCLYKTEANDYRIVLSKWINKSKTKAWYPLHQQQADIQECILNQEQPDPDVWTIIDLKMLIAAKDNYISAKDCLNMIKNMTDPESEVDDEKLRKSRHKRLLKARKNLFSSDDSDEDDVVPVKRGRIIREPSQLPQPPIDFTGLLNCVNPNMKDTKEQCATAAQSTAWSTAQSIAQSTAHPITEVLIQIPDDSPTSSKKNTFSDKETNLFSDVDEEHPLPKKQIPPQVDLTQLSVMDMLKLVYEGLNLVTKKVNSIIHTQKELKMRLVHLEESGTVCRQESQEQFGDIADSLESLLPMKTYEEFVTFEEKLNKKRFYNNTARYMKSLGGDTHHDLVRGILDRFMSNCLAVKFNMDGKFLKRKMETVTI